MTIKREVNGKMMEFELTYNEMCNAYFEQEHVFDMEDVRAYYDYDDETSGDRRRLTEEHAEEVATLAREWMDENDGIAETRWNCIDDAIKEVLK